MNEPIDFALKPGARPGDSAFLLNQGRHRLAFDGFPGRYIALAILPSTSDPAAVMALHALAGNQRHALAGKAVLFAVVAESRSASQMAVEAAFPSIRFLWDGADLASAFGDKGSWIILDPMLRVVDAAPLSDGHCVFAHLDRLPPPSEASGASPAAPILTLARVLEPELCRHLVACFERGESRESGFMQDEDGRSVERFDSEWKRRRDLPLTDLSLIAHIRTRIGRRVCPEIKKAFQFVASRIERDLVARYDSETGGRFGPHRDDTGILVAHRRFAVSINLNDDFDGGEISFPEYGPRSFKAGPGTAVVFSCSILHQVSRVTRGRRYVFLTFLFDEDAERLRLANLKSVREAQRQSPQTENVPA